MNIKVTTKTTFFPNSYASSSGSVYQPFKQSTLSNLHNKKTDNYAETELVHGKKQPLRRPGAVTVSNFKCNLPTGSIVTKITVHYAHSKVEYNKKVCNIPAPTITIMDGKNSRKWSTGKPMAKIGKAPTTKIQKYSISYGCNLDYTVFNTKDFGVNINYPTNANNDEGYMRLYYVYVVLEYRSPSFALKATGAIGNTGYNGDDYIVTLELSNKNNTRYLTSVVLTAPAGFSYQDATGNGTIEKVQNNVYQWTPHKMIGYSTVSIALRFNVNITFPSGSSSYTGTFSARETLLGKQGTHTAVITPKPPEPKTDSETSKNTGSIGDNSYSASVTVKVNEESTLEIVMPEFIREQVNRDTIIKDGYTYTRVGLPYCQIGIALSGTGQVFGGNSPIYTGSFPLQWEGDMDFSHWEFDEQDHLVPSVPFEFKVVSPGVYRIHFTITIRCDWVCNDIPGGDRIEYYYKGVLGDYYLNITPSNLTTPPYSILSLSSEELNRLGDQTPYILQSHLRETTSEEYPRDWGRNFRLGVFNNAITDNITTITIPTNNDSEEEYEEITIDTTDYDNLTPTEIFNNAEYWSPTITEANTFENIECKFPYNKNYPLYILITGDYPEATTQGIISYTEPCIIEEDYYNSRETNGTYPIPIENTKRPDGDFSELNIESLGTSSPLIFYDFPFDEDYGTNEEIAIRGIEVTGTIEQNTDDINVYAKLRSPTGESRTRSINLDVLDTNVNSDNKFSLGGMGDLWGLSTLDMTNLKDWEIEFLADNTINSETGTLNFRDISLIVYISQVDVQNITCKVEGENLSYYGAFIIDVEIPEGLKTDVDFLTINGTDTNDPYRQNIREKEITIKLDIGDNCDLQGSTLSLRDLARLFQNKRDKYNRPIPKKIEFSHYPDVYWEYIMESPFDNPIEISSYEVKIKLTVPSGTAYKKQSTVTNRTGYVNGLANVSPVIVIKPTDNLMTITETLTDQNFHIGYPETLTDKVIVIDCEDRIVWLKTDEDDTDGENITQYVDFNSDWFSIIDEYQFDTTGCVIKDVSYIERW